jgi:hypothetical protein
MQWLTKAAEQGNYRAQLIIGEIYLTGFEEGVPVGTFDRDVPFGMKYLRALTVAERKSERHGEVVSRANSLISAFHAAKSCMGCGSPKARKLCRTARLPAAGAWTPAKPRCGTAAEPAS